ncbi:aprataxin isoform X2 [Parasteatoda tepidariorum]|uniref:aprataxin isoform X2 n=1 Tax=Parasteatoda tepidariorum TaxID=114398 RepID=UPI001C71F9FE|nr:aprataxin isoform X2 [Parasteatoda tepidariorum]
MSFKRGTENNSVALKKAKIGHWSQGLKASMEDPELLVESDDLVVIIKDKYPKARHHYLILPKENIPDLKSLKSSHLPLLKHMHEQANKLTERINSECGVRIGYHAVPSMSHLHLHVISQDFDSPCLKTKTHWNSFTTEYFIDSEDIIRDLENNSCVKCIDPNKSKELLKLPLRCHNCKQELPTMPKLKSHVLNCKKK